MSKPSVPLSEAMTSFFVSGPRIPGGEPYRVGHAAISSDHERLNLWTDEFSLKW